MIGYLPYCLTPIKPQCTIITVQLIFIVSWKQSAASRWSWTFPSQLLVAHSQTWMMKTNVLPFEGSIWTQKLPLMLWEKNGRVMWAESVVGMTNKVFPLSTVAWPMAKSTCYWGRSSPVIDQRNMERGSEICSELHSECQCECSQLGYCKNEIFLILLCLTAGTYVPPTPDPRKKNSWILKLFSH